MIRVTDETDTQAISNHGADDFSDEDSICQFFSEGEFFAEPDVTGTVEIALKHFYCFSKNRWTECRRLEHYQETGEKPPVTMLPNGRVMPR